MKAPVILAALLISTPLFAADKEHMLAYRLEVRAEQARKIETREDAMRVLDEVARRQGFKDHADFIAKLPPEVITCNFTEPFFSIEWKAATREAKTVRADLIEYDDQGKVINEHAEVAAGAQKLTTGSLAYEIVTATGGLLVQLKLDYQGSDGMSDTIYPYSAIAGGMHGGCSTNLLPNKTLE